MSYSKPLDEYFDSFTGNKVLIIHKEIPQDLPQGVLINLHREKAITIHDIFNYPSEFIPEIPRWVISKYSSPKEVVLDPFIGGGATAVECMILGRNCIGVELNPLACLVTEVKTTKYNCEEVEKCGSKLLQEIYERIRGHHEIFIPSYKNIRFWFSPQSMKGLSAIKQAIEEVENEALRKLFMVIFAKTVRKSSKVAEGQVLQARRPKRGATNEITDPVQVCDIFKTEFERTKHILHMFSEKLHKDSWTTIIQGDTLQLPKMLEEIRKYPDIVITSPPYINAIDYVWAFKLELHWLGLVKDDEHRLNLMKKQIGTENIPASLYRNLKKTGFPELDNKIEDIYYGRGRKASGEQNKLRAYVVYKYFKDIEQHLNHAYSFLPSRGFYIYAIGENTITNVRIETWKHILQMAENIGFKKVFEVGLLLKNKLLNYPRNLPWANEIKYDKIIVLKK